MIYENKEIMSLNSFIDEFSLYNNLSEMEKQNVAKTILGENYEE